MYAKLVFPTGTANTEVCRDIVRAIENSTGAGGSTVGALEFVDAGNSTIDDTVAANWSLAAGQTIGTGAAVEQDKEFFLQQAHSNGSTKTVAIRMHNKDTSGFTKAENVSGYNSVVLTPVLDYGETYQSIPFRPSDASSANTSTAPSQGVTALLNKSTVHIIARDKVIAIIGDQWGYLPGRSFMAILEAPEQYENRIGRNKPAQSYFWGSERFSSSFNANTLSNKTSVIDYTSTNFMGTAYGQPLAYAMMDTLHNTQNDLEVRFSLLVKRNWTSSIASPANADPSQQMYMASVGRDTAQADGYNTNWNYDTVGSINTESFLFPPMSSNWAFTPHAYSFDPVASHLNVDLRNQNPSKLDGTPTAQLFPVGFATGDSGGYYDFSTECGLYIGTNNVPRGISIINDGTDDYVTLRIFDTSNRDGVIALRK